MYVELAELAPVWQEALLFPLLLSKERLKEVI